MLFSDSFFPFCFIEIYQDTTFELIYYRSLLVPSVSYSLTVYLSSFIPFVFYFDLSVHLKYLFSGVSIFISIWNVDNWPIPWSLGGPLFGYSFLFYFGVLLPCFLGFVELLGFVCLFLRKNLKWSKVGERI